MRCPECNASLGKTSHSGEKMLRVRGIILKASRIVGICPKCRADVPMTAPDMRRMHDIYVLFMDHEHTSDRS